MAVAISERSIEGTVEPDAEVGGNSGGGGKGEKQSHRLAAPVPASEQVRKNENAKRRSSQDRDQQTPHKNEFARSAPRPANLKRYQRPKSHDEDDTARPENWGRSDQRILGELQWHEMLSG